MARERDYENIDDIDELDDRELRDLVRERLAEHTALDIDDITVRVQDGNVVLAGRVGTDGERRVAEHVLTDVLGLVDLTFDQIDKHYLLGEKLGVDRRLFVEELRRCLVDPPAVDGKGKA